jgi:hypothetical protein
MTDFAQAKRDIAAIEQWLVPGSINFNQLTMEQLEELTPGIG